MADLENVLVASVTQTHNEWAQKFAQALGIRQRVPLVINRERFKNGDVSPVRKTDLNGKQLVITAFASPHKDPQEIIYRTGEMAESALNDYGATGVDVVMPFHLKSRQDSREQEHPGDPKWVGKSLNLRWVVKTMKAAGVSHVLTCHVHSPLIYDIYAKVYGVVDGRQVLHEVDPAPVAVHYVKTKSSFDLTDSGRNLVVIGPDKGSWNFIDDIVRLSGLSNVPKIKMHKWRDLANDPLYIRTEIANLDELLSAKFSFAGTSAVVFDDMADTCGTFLRDQEKILEMARKFGWGIPKDWSFYFTHPVLGGKDYEHYQGFLISNLKPKEIITTNTLPFIDEEQESSFRERCTVLRLAYLFADLYKNCTLKGGNPLEYQRFESFEQVDERVGGLYKILRDPELHFLEKPQ